MYKGIFITAIDTGVGKTYVSCTIAEAAKKAAISCGIFKPVSTGNRNDAKILIKASGVNEKAKTVTPLFYKNPMSPYGASLLENKKIDLNAAYKGLQYFLKKYEFTVVEGIGGLMVPLKKNYFVIDMIKKFNLPVIVVARFGLGTLNHTLLTADKLKSCGQKVLGIILSGKINKSDISAKTNAKIIREITKLPVLELGYNEKIDLKKNAWIIK
ncbi:MAG: dethiobiotin synthase [Endomicrobium sp.]|jgi:dethiobiotin synthetase|nr:dethiobiotin synthase [Endomicrobium sp.]